MIETNLLHFGYLFIVLGTIVEGDATLLTAAFLARRGYFELPMVLVVAALSTWAASFAYFLAARRAGAKALKTLGARAPGLEWVMARAERRAGLLLIGARFMIGFRTLIPIVCGSIGVGPVRFMLWNSVGAILWALAFGAVGYLGGHLSTILLSDIRRHETAVAVALAIGCGGFILLKTRGRELRDLWSLLNAF